MTEPSPFRNVQLNPDIVITGLRQANVAKDELIAQLRAEVERLRNEVANAVRIFNTVRGQFQSYEECYEEENCADSYAHEPRKEMDEFVERNEAKS